VFSEVKIVTFSVSDIERALSFYTNLLGYKIIASGEVPKELYAPWQIPEHLHTQCALLAADDSGNGMLRMLQFSEEGESIWTEENRLYGCGSEIINFRAQDAETFFLKLVENGATGTSKPTYWDITPEISVCESIVHDLDKISLDIFSYTKGAEKRGPLETIVSPVQTIAICTHDIEASQHFYRQMGYEVLFDKTIDHLNEMLGLDDDIKFRNINLIKDGHIIPGRVELYQYIGIDDEKRMSFKSRVQPPNIGIQSISFEVEIIEKAVNTMITNGAQLISDPVTASVPGLGNIQVATVLGLNDERIEFFTK
jgi:catechol 2,3-dioxygenase-like lactoylglutathione lyase family enzyme